MYFAVQPPLAGLLAMIIFVQSSSLVGAAHCGYYCASLALLFSEYVRANFIFQLEYIYL